MSVLRAQLSSRAEVVRRYYPQFNYSSENSTEAVRCRFLVTVTARSRCDGNFCLPVTKHYNVSCITHRPLSSVQHASAVSLCMTKVQQAQSSFMDSEEDVPNFVSYAVPSNDNDSKNTATIRIPRINSMSGIEAMGSESSVKEFINYNPMELPSKQFQFPATAVPPSRFFSDSCRHLNLAKLITQRIWLPSAHGERKGDLWKSIALSLYLQCVIDNNDVTNALNILRYCIKKEGVHIVKATLDLAKLSSSVDDTGLDAASTCWFSFARHDSDNPGMHQYELPSVKIINNLLLMFSTMNVKSYAQSVEILTEIMGLTEQIVRCRIDRDTANLETVFSLLLVLVRHRLYLGDSTLKTDSQEHMWKRAFTEAIENEVRLLVRTYKFNVNKILLERSVQHKLCLSSDDAVIAKLKELFPEAEPELPAASLKAHNYNCPLLNHLNNGDSNVALRIDEKLDVDRVCNEERALEENRFVEVKSLFCDDNSYDQVASFYDYVAFRWENELRETFHEFLKELNKANDVLIVKPFYNVLDPEQFIRTMLNKLLCMVHDVNVPEDQYFKKSIFVAEASMVVQLQSDIGRHIMSKISQTNDKVFEIYKHYVRHLTERTPESQRFNHRQLWRHCATKLYGTEFEPQGDMFKVLQWPSGLKTLIFEPLLELLLGCVRIFQDVAKAKALFEQGDFGALNKLPMIEALTLGSKKAGEKKNFKPVAGFWNLRRSQALVDFCVSVASERKTLVIETEFLPMLSPPVPRMDVYFGGKLDAQRVSFLRSCTDYSKAIYNVLNKTPRQQLFPAFDALNLLGSVPWKINNTMLDLTIKVLKTGSNVFALSMPLPDTEWPEQPENFNGRGEFRRSKRQRYKDIYPRFADFLVDMQKATTAARYRSYWAARKHFIELKLSVVQQVLVRLLEILAMVLVLFPQSLLSLVKTPDIVVYVEFGLPRPFVSKLCMVQSNRLVVWDSPDIDRSLLLFAEGRPLGGKKKDCSGRYEFDGLDWLKIHLANLEGKQKKKRLDERLHFVEEHMADVLASADSPLECTWWQQCEKPWQTLATSIEISNALRSGNPETYICHFPVHQDGSCNGLQHYAALGRDNDAALEVNLRPSERPGDIYSHVAEIAELRRREDAANGNEAAKLCEGIIDRGLVKQTVMTIVYGVTIYGAKTQVMGALKEKRFLEGMELRPLAFYLSSIIFKSIDSLFQNSRLIQWIGEVTTSVTKDFAQPVQWVTPVGLPVVQPYSQLIHSERSDLDDETEEGDNEHLKVYQSHESYAEKPLIAKQFNATAPNYIHSLDSTHMMLTAIHSERAGITFNSVHDCFWTHPCDVSRLNEICREQFVKLHSQDLLGQFAGYLLPLATTNMSTYSAKRKHALYLRDLLVNKRPKKGSLDLEEIKRSTYFFS